MTTQAPQPAPQAPQPKPEAPSQIIFKERKSVLDRVKEDGVMRELIQNQEKAQLKWEDRWGFLKNPRKLWEEEAAKRGLPQDIFDKRNNRRKQVSWLEYRKPTVQLKESTKVPEITSGFIGWRSSIRENDLNLICGPLYISPTHTMDPPLSPSEPDPKNQRFIYLG